MYNGHSDLPHGWDMKWDPNTKQHFFIDHNTKSTTWRDPRKTYNNNPNADYVEIPIQRENNLQPTNIKENTGGRSRSASPFVQSSLESIYRIQENVKPFEERVIKFTGNKKEKEYLFLENALEKLLLQLDTLESDGDNEIRVARKEAVKQIQAILDKLEKKASDFGIERSGTSTTQQTDKSVEQTTEQSNIGKPHSEGETMNVCEG